MSKLNLKAVKDVKIFFKIEKSKGNMVNFTVNNWRKLHHEPMQRRVHRRRVRYSSCKRHK